MGSIHDGHRDRIRRRVENESLDYFEPHEILELLLFYVERQGDTNATAHELIEKFGSLSEVLDADRSKLEEVKGIGKNASFFLHLIPQICRRYMMSKSDNSAAKIINNSELAHEILAPYFIGRTVETLYMLCLNNHGEQIACEYISEGTVNATSINMKKIVSIVIKTNASAVILCQSSGRRSDSVKAGHPADEEPRRGARFHRRYPS